MGRRGAVSGSRHVEGCRSAHSTSGPVTPVFLISQVLGHAAAVSSQSIAVSQPELSPEHKRGYKYVKT